MTTTKNNEHKKLNFPNEQEQSQACLNSAEHEKNQGRKVLNVPNLRFKEFQGEWTTSLLSDYLTENKERNKKGEFDKTDVLSVSGDYGIVNQIELLGRSFAGASVLPYHVVRHGNIVYTKSPLKEYPYGIVKANTGVDGIVSTLYAVYNIKNNVDAQFIEFYFSSANRTNRYFKPIVRIGAKHDMKIGNQEVLANKVTFPNLEEQTKIASLFRFLDERIATQNKIIDKLQSLIKGISNIIFASIQGREYRMGEIATITNGDSNVQDAVTEPKEGMYPFFDRSEDIKYLPTFLFDKEALIYPGEGAEFMPRYIKGKFALHQRCYAIFDFEDIVNVQFLYFYLKTQNSYFIRNAVGSTVPSLRLDTFQKLKVIIPPKVMQRKVSLCLSSIEQKCNAEKVILQSLLKQKQYLLRQMFI